MDKRSAIAFLLLIIHLICGVLALIYFTAMSISFKGPFLHGFLGLISMLFIACALSTFRISHGYNTRNLKFVHLVLHIFALISLIVCLVVVRPSLFAGISSCAYMHGVPGLVFVAFYVLQFILALIFFLLCLTPPARTRFAPIHDIIGVWLYMCLVGAAITGEHDCKTTHSQSHTTGEMFWCIQYMNAFKTLVICNTFLLHTIVLLPFFDWIIIGSL